MIIPQHLDDVLDAVVPAGRSLLPDPDGARLKADVIVQHNQLAGRIRLVKSHRLLHGLSREIHEGLRLHQEHLLPLDSPLPQSALNFLSPTSIRYRSARMSITRTRSCDGYVHIFRPDCRALPRYTSMSPLLPFKPPDDVRRPLQWSDGPSGDGPFQRFSPWRTLPVPPQFWRIP